MVTTDRRQSTFSSVPSRGAPPSTPPVAGMQAVRVRDAVGVWSGHGPQMRNRHRWTPFGLLPRGSGPGARLRPSSGPRDSEPCSGQFSRPVSVPLFLVCSTCWALPPKTHSWRRRWSGLRATTISSGMGLEGHPNKSDPLSEWAATGLFFFPTRQYPDLGHIYIYVWVFSLPHMFGFSFGADVWQPSWSVAVFA